MMMKRCVVAAVLVAALAGLFEQNEANEYESALTKLDNWLVNQPKRPENNPWWEDIDFIEDIGLKSMIINKELRDTKVLNLMYLLPKYYARGRFGRESKCYPKHWTILGDLIETIERSNETAAASSRNDGPLRRLLKNDLKQLKTCYNELFLNRFVAIVQSAVNQGSQKKLGPLSGPEIKNLFDEMERQSWIEHLFDSKTRRGLIKETLEAKSRLRKGEDPSETDGLLRAIAMSIYPRVDEHIGFRDEQTGAYVVVKFTKAQAMDYFEKNMRKPCESYLRAARPLVDPAARIVEEGGKVDYCGGKMVKWYLACEVVVEMKFTEEMADAVVKELEERHNRFKKTFGLQQ